MKKSDRNHGKHEYLDDIESIITDDTVAYTRNMKKMSSELLKPHPTSEILHDLAQTYILIEELQYWKESGLFMMPVTSFLYWKNLNM